MGCCIYPVFLISKHPWQAEGGCRYSLVVGRHFWCCVLPAFCWVGHMLSGCKVWMQSRWVDRWSWQSVLQISRLVLSGEGCIHYPWKWWWEFAVLGWENPGHGELFFCVSGKPELIVYLHNGDVNPGVDKDWYGWVSERLCDLGNRPLFCRYKCPAMEGGLLLFPMWTASCCGVHWGC